MKRLKLRTETIRALATLELRAAVGGRTDPDCSDTRLRRQETTISDAQGSCPTDYTYLCKP